MVGAHEEVVERELVAGGAAQADRVPDVGPLHVLGAYQHGPLERGAVGVVFGRPVGGVDRAVRPEPGRMPAAGCKGPHAGHPASRLRIRPRGPWGQAPRQNRARIAEDRLRHRQVQIGRRHCAAAGLAEAPGGGRIGFGDGFNDVEKVTGSVSIPLVERGSNSRNNCASCSLSSSAGGSRREGLDVGGSCCDIGTYGLSPGDHRPVAGKIGRVCNRCIQDHACRSIASVCQSLVES